MDIRGVGGSGITTRPPDQTDNQTNQTNQANEQERERERQQTQQVQSTPAPGTGQNVDRTA
jgi:hypothetical protein